MVREAIAILPDALTRFPPGAAAGCAIIGAILWAAGARYSRSILALVAVAGGTIIGLHLPAWCGWQIDGMGLAVGAAIVLGTCAFLMHRTCIGVMLGMTMMLWAGLGTWIAMAGDMYWDYHAVSWKGDLVQLCRDASQTLPSPVAHAFPFACFAGFAAGITITVVSAKFSKVLAYSLAGVTLMVAMGGIAAATFKPQWLVNLPGSNLVQGLVLVGLVVAGVLVQWRLTPPRRSPARASSAPRTS